MKKISMILSLCLLMIGVNASAQTVQKETDKKETTVKKPTLKPNKEKMAAEKTIVSPTSEKDKARATTDKKEGATDKKEAVKVEGKKVDKTPATTTTKMKDVKKPVKKAVAGKTSK